MRLRLIGGSVRTAALRDLLDVAGQWGDGTVLLTKRTNLQLRGIDHHDGQVPAGLVDAIAEIGLLPSPTHELVRNVMTSPLTGRLGGHADLRPVALELDRLLCADPDLADLAGRFLFVLDDGRGDVLARPLDLGLVAVSAEQAQLRLGSGRWGEVVGTEDAAGRLVDLARRFLRVHGSAWHVDELPDVTVLAEPLDRDPRTEVRSEPPSAGPLVQHDGLTCEHVEVPDGVLTAAVAGPILDRAGPEVIVTGWRSLLLPDLEPS